MGVRHADLFAQAGNNDAEDQGCDPGEYGAGLAGRGALRDLGTDGLEVAQSRRCPRPEPHAAPVADDAEPGAGGRRGGAAQGASPAAR